MKRLITLSLLLLTILLLGACTDDYNAAEDMYEHLEKSVELESSFKSAQSELGEIEKQENEIYDEMMEINMNELDQIQGLADEALSLAENRKDLIEQEKESIDAAKEEFNQIEQYLDELSDETKEKANQMIEEMEKRHQSFNDLYDAYTHSINLDIELYEMLKNEDLKKADLDEQVDRVNTSYQEVKSAQDKFNQHTGQFNDLKKEFYESSGLNVEFEEE
ncbi:YkyA family protein [Tenuibacillus multivorans]|uniref:Putative cell-wall binding lipoprotein n=1 Tax=Tenuibacillus multivorans TaxID=237069 RepID=A0A1G9YDW9_9BACI|nr:YkyA family protein [Tenuibacillus multivorans]GEL76036.1 hypothetical protein TMU01_02710 [Tenuibacillus multivorans]SDN06603.1 Putative cell-wall binding lipoprotein [Tenuibacillus multivorans]